MKEIYGSFKHWFRRTHPIHNGQPLQNGIVQIIRPRGASAKNGSAVEWLVEFPLEENAALPPGAQILANDEMLPAGTFYLVALFGKDCFGFCHCHICGKSPIDVRHWVCLWDADFGNPYMNHALALSCPCAGSVADVR
jgi:hypothetical protein